jgi:predicted transcriptional regulator of viral defense system
MILVYLDTKDSILLKANDTSFHALYHIIQQTDLLSNTWYADNFNKNLIVDELGVSLPALEKMIASLRERGLLIKIQRGKYRLPDHFLDY